MRNGTYANEIEKFLSWFRFITCGVFVKNKSIIVSLRSHHQSDVM